MLHSNCSIIAPDAPEYVILLENLGAGLLVALVVSACLMRAPAVDV